MRARGNAKKKSKTIRTCFSLPLELVPLLNQAAVDSGQSRSGYLTWLLRNAIEQAQEKA